LGGTKLDLNSPVLEQLAEPLGVLDVGLSAGHIVDVLGIHQQQVEIVLHQVVDRLPPTPGAPLNTTSMSCAPGGGS
jgi:hypothetical protein